MSFNNLPARRPIRLVALDIDGTLMCGGQIAPGNPQAIDRAQRAGVIVALATVRLAKTAGEVARQLGVGGPLICGLGACAYERPDAAELWHWRIPQALAQEIAAFADAHDFELCTTLNGLTYYRQRPGQTLGPWMTNRWIVPDNRSAITADPTCLLAYGTTAVALDAQFRAAFGPQLTFRLDYVGGQPNSLTIVHGQASKGLALAELCRRLGIPTEAVLAMGDSEADVDMFRLPGVLSVAVAGAPEDVRQAAQVVAPPCAAGAVAWALEQFVL